MDTQKEKAVDPSSGKRIGLPNLPIGRHCKRVSRPSNEYHRSLVHHLSHNAVFGGLWGYIQPIAYPCQWSRPNWGKTLQSCEGVLDTGYELVFCRTPKRMCCQGSSERSTGSASCDYNVEHGIISCVAADIKTLDLFGVTPELLRSAWKRKILSRIFQLKQCQGLARKAQ
jgi:hypothetical protein